MLIRELKDFRKALKYHKCKFKAMETKLKKGKRGRPKKPTMRWIYQIFEGVHVLYRLTKFGTTEMVLNLNSLRIKILQRMGPIYQKIYEDGGLTCGIWVKSVYKNGGRSFFFESCHCFKA